MHNITKPRLKHRVEDLPEGIFGCTERVDTSGPATTVSEVSKVIKWKGQTAAIIGFLALTNALKTVSQEVIHEQLVWSSLATS